jgi:hypothetical protein
MDDVRPSGISPDNSEAERSWLGQTTRCHHGSVGSRRMDEIVSLARSARESLAGVLQALQLPGVPYRMRDVAEPVAMAMRAFYLIEASRGEALVERAPVALTSVRRALSMLQDQSVHHPVWDDVQQAMLESLGAANAINSAAPTRPAVKVATSRARPASEAGTSDPARIARGIRVALRRLDQGSVEEAKVALVGLLDELAV